MVLLDLTKQMISVVMGVMARQRSRRALLDMDSHRLYDIGLTADEAHQEAYKPVWKR